MSVPSLVARPLSMMRAFLAAEAAGGIILIGAAALGMLIANSAQSATYFHTLHIDIGGLSLLTNAMSFAAEPVFELALQSAGQLLDRGAYLRGVLGEAP